MKVCGESTSRSSRTIRTNALTSLEMFVLSKIFLRGYAERPGLRRVGAHRVQHARGYGLFCDFQGPFSFSGPDKKKSFNVIVPEKCATADFAGIPDEQWAFRFSVLMDNRDNQMPSLAVVNYTLEGPSCDLEKKCQNATAFTWDEYVQDVSPYCDVLADISVVNFGAVHAKDLDPPP